MMSSIYQQKNSYTTIFNYIDINISFDINKSFDQLLADPAIFAVLQLQA
jgi:hypothetical protein